MSNIRLSVLSTILTILDTVGAASFKTLRNNTLLNGTSDKDIGEALTYGIDTAKLNFNIITQRYSRRIG